MEFGVYLLGLTIAGATIWPAFLVDFALAYLSGIVFQFSPIAPMRPLNIKDGLVAAIKADTLPIIADEAVMFVSTGLAYFVSFPRPHLKPSQATYWFIMQIAMVIAFVDGYPIKRRLTRKGLKEAMSCG